MSTNLGGAPCCCFGLTQLQPAAVRLRLPPARATDTSASQSPARLRAVLEQVDQALSKGNDEAALSLVRSSQGGDGGLRAFGAARQVCAACIHLPCVLDLDDVVLRSCFLVPIRTISNNQPAVMCEF